MASRTLVVVRHAKAERQAPTDFERRLADRGRVDAADLGSWLAEQGVVPDAGLVSAAQRTDETWDAVAAAAGWTCRPRLTRSLYLADEAVVLQQVREFDDDATTAVVVGHNPTMHALAVWLDDGEGDAAARGAIASSYPTSAATVLTFEGSWTDLAPGTATVRAVHVGRG
ncbi:histidine phosphatase family protein [Nocardioides sp. CFH 31398]|uniref:SixA phosphatase family protein n=1 Tax=Nocardioides sp. CFH 31398 TaxID=2919579 RepID=UPI001F05BA14|nr:histidine phosphatase family protein [Nocardioides sp. CFH 31398]MCH1866782.1 histidine phosphatase family protein [Nocardioides sp. CFH 31398]